MSKKNVDYNTPFAEQFGEWMRAANHTSMTLARVVNATPQAIRHWRAGNAIPSNTAWRPLATALGVPVEVIAVACIPKEAA